MKITGIVLTAYDGDQLVFTFDLSADSAVTIFTAAPPSGREAAKDSAKEIFEPLRELLEQTLGLR